MLLELFSIYFLTLSDLPKSPFPGIPCQICHSGSLLTDRCLWTSIDKSFSRKMYAENEYYPPPFDTPYETTTLGYSGAHGYSDAQGYSDVQEYGGNLPDQYGAQSFATQQQQPQRHPQQSPDANIPYGSYCFETYFHPHLQNGTPQSVAFSPSHSLLYIGGTQVTGTPQFTNQRNSSTGRQKKTTTYCSGLSTYTIPECEVYSSVKAHNAVPEEFMEAPSEDDVVKHYKVKGVTKILPYEEFGPGGGGGCVSLSLQGARMHMRGGMLLGENEIKGVQTGAFNPTSEGGYSFVTVGGVCVPGSQLHCLDVYSGLKTKSTVDIGGGVTCLEGCYGKAPALLAGCTDGTIRVMDGMLRGHKKKSEIQIRAHSGGITNIAVSDDGHTIATTGLVSSTTTKYPDQQIYTFDLRMPTKAGIPSQFPGSVTPKFIKFAENSLTTTLVACGRKGALQVIEPFGDPVSKYVDTGLQQGEQITDMAMSSSSSFIALSTNAGRVCMLGRCGFGRTVNLPSRDPTTGEEVVRKLATPHMMTANDMSTAYIPNPPMFKIDSSLLSSNGPKQLNPFNLYTIRCQPHVSNDLNDPLRDQVFYENNYMRVLSQKLQDVAASNKANNPGDHDHVQHVRCEEVDSTVDPTSINNNTLLYGGGLDEFAKKKKKKKRLANEKIYNIHADPRDKYHEKRRESTVNLDVPQRYRKTARPNHLGVKNKFTFHYGKHNDTGLWPGADSGHMANEYASPIILVLYFIPELRASLLREQYNLRNFERRPTAAGAPCSVLCAELGFVFNQVDSLANYAGLSLEDNVDVGAFSPVNFLSNFAILPEAAALALLDGSSTAVKLPRRIEAFYRFLVHHLNQEIEINTPTVSTPTKNMSVKGGGGGGVGGGAPNSSTGENSGGVVDDLQGFDFTSLNEFVSGAAAGTFADERVTRALTVELNYDKFCGRKALDINKKPSFSDVLTDALCRETRLRAWCAATKSYETIIQRRRISNLPTLLAISCACAGGGEGISLWRTEDHFLPEKIKVVISGDGRVTVTENAASEVEGEEEKRGACKSIEKYELITVVSHVVSGDGDENNGHHVSHVRVPRDYTKRALTRQASESEKAAVYVERSENAKDDNKNHITMARKLPPDVYRARATIAREKADEVNTDNSPETDWVCFNGFVVTKTIMDDARAFHPEWKEPCIAIYRKITSTPTTAVPDEIPKTPGSKGGGVLMSPEMIKITDGGDELGIPVDVMNAMPIGSRNNNVNFGPGFNLLPGSGDLVAIDTEFVCVQHEESSLTASGAKSIITEGRSALARVSVIDCRTGGVIIDDYVLPQEPVLDYLTRFSGIEPADLDRERTRHHLVTSHTAYLKIRLLVDRGCVFVGHGLEGDFRIINVHVPPTQIVDTLHIFQQPQARMISLRFLSNFLRGHDMQTLTHDSIEDARASWECYRIGIKLMEKGEFDRALTKIYEFGRKTDWKLGVKPT